MTVLDHLSCVRTFVVVVRAGSFTQAGLRLGLTISAVGKRMARLEQHVGLPLFHRSSRHLRLTLDSQAYFESCAAALDQIDAALASFGLCQMPSSLLRQPMADGKLVPVLGDHSGTPVDVHLVWSRHATLSPRVRFVVDHLVAAGERGDLD